MTFTHTPSDRRALKRWHRTEARQENLAGWRTTLSTARTTKNLTVGYAVALAVAFVCMLAMNVVDPATALLSIYLAAMLGAMIAFTLLRISIGTRDRAPALVLDDYEQEVLTLWRGRAATAMSVALIAGGIALAMLFPLLATESTPATPVAVTAGLYMIFVHLAAGTLPTVGYAATFNRNPEE